MDYPDEAAFDAELNRLTSICIRIVVAAKKEGIEVGMMAMRAAETGLLAPEDYEIVSRVFLAKD
ncbi:hypothetical protein [Belnapia sp. F-4-1]|uniref:hypothetical protein n=1 Tax=Belnapia sp. F-4-1 TaxID=1545443 RepID=UPI0005BC0A43|nr:hypothetical protein [Belnapia sp. F-4-1]